MNIWECELTYDVKGIPALTFQRNRLFVIMIILNMGNATLHSFYTTVTTK